MSDWMFASEGDSGNVGRPGPARQPPYRNGGGPPFGAPPENAAVGVARRLQARVDHHLTLLEQLYPEPLGFSQLVQIAKRMRRDTESMLLLSGEDPGGRSGGPRRLSDVLNDAVGAAEETWRVVVRPAPATNVVPAAAVEFVHVLAEVVDHVTAVFPEARIDVASFLDNRSGVAVEVSVTGAGLHDADGLGGRRAYAAAQALAQRSRSGITLTRQPPGPLPDGAGLVATVSCPGTALLAEDPLWPNVMASGGLGPNLMAPSPPYGPSHSGTNGNGQGYANGYGPAAAVLGPPSAPAYTPSVSSQVDELFGPMVDLPQEPLGEGAGTPIFEAIASAWFRNDAAAPDATTNGQPVDWESPSDVEWREAAARAAQPEPPASNTASGLPRRRPGNQLVPPPRRRTPGNEPAERVPDRVRDRLSTYQRGLRQGRHRAPGEE